jgi:DNA gyrase subunit B
VGVTRQRGTTVRFKPSAAIFTNIVFRLRDPGEAAARAVVPEFRRAHRAGRRARRQADVFEYEGGLQAFVKHLNRARTAVARFGVPLPSQEAVIGVEVALQWNDSYQESMFCYTNNIPQKDGGTHLSGFRAALTRTLNDYIEKEGARNGEDRHHRR